ncbi:cytochrome C oxidase subunit IV family protein [Haliangium sp.]|uniref:cytochrome C oxidase subunit IV family protein n=1 Tax=Haliangium sp. TaxID=2663208 RepID=UPI003D0A4AC4
MASHSEHDEHLIGHVVPVKILLGVFGALLVLTVVTVLVAGVDFGGKSINLGIAMAIAAVKASLVILYFMHIRYDKLFHSVLIGSGLLAAALFVAFALVDRGQYEDLVIWDEARPPAVAPRVN